MSGLREHLVRELRWMNWMKLAQSLQFAKNNKPVQYQITQDIVGKICRMIPHKNVGPHQKIRAAEALCTALLLQRDIQHELGDQILKDIPTLNSFKVPQYPWNLVIHNIAHEQLNGVAVGTIATGGAEGTYDICTVLMDSINDNGFEIDEGKPIDVPNVQHLVLPGVARRTNNSRDYMIRTHREEVILVLDRSKVESPRVTKVSAIVYNAKAVLADPQVDPGMKAHFQERPDDHLLVTLLTEVEGYQPAVSPHRFARNLAGGNAKYDWDKPETVVQVRSEAGLVVEMAQGWCTLG